MSLFSKSHYYFKTRIALHWVSVIIFCGVFSSTAKAFEEGVVLVPEVSIASEINALIGTKQHPQLKWSDFSNRAENLQHFYELGGFQLVWFGSERALQNTQTALSVLQQAAAQGLKAEHYELAELQRWVDSAKNNAALDVKQVVLYDTAISIVMLRYMYDLHFGQVDPHTIDFKFALRPKNQDLAELLYQSIQAGTLANLNTNLEPQLKQYKLLKQALADYRDLAKELGATQFSAPVKGKQIAQLHRYLQGVGDIPMQSEVKENHLQEVDIAGLKKFQHRHGLDETGYTDKATVAALNTPLSQRISQIELAMERLRWLPEINAEPGILVNIPAFKLWAYNSLDTMDEVAMHMRVVVGEAMKNPTPVLISQVQYLEFMPHWNVPYSIVKNEIIAKLVRNSNYLRDQNMEVVATTDRSQAEPGYQPSLIDELKHGNVRIRQRPGKHNALGRVKFIFPNEYSVYLHDTQANALFKKPRRDFSHGCVRVEQPEALAEYMLRDSQKWDADAVKHAMHQENQQRVSLKKPLPVLIFYTTAFFETPEQLRFYPDIYAYDSVLREALAKPVEVADSALFAQDPEVRMTGLE